MKNAAVAAARVKAGRRFFFQNQDGGSRMAALQFQRGGKTDDARAQNDVIGCWWARNETSTRNEQTRRTKRRMHFP